MSFPSDEFFSEAMFHLGIGFRTMQDEGATPEQVREKAVAVKSAIGEFIDFLEKLGDGN